MNQERLLKVLLAPVISEKSTRIGELYRQFAFKVARDATKPEIKKAVETMFKVEVDKVRVCNVKGKVKRFRGRPGRRPGWKKAYVSLKPGHDIKFGE
ncbi:MAG: 50S ribosomal protein L23 [Gammaproteobacteria bacterium]|nr:MAG: 50S ribosomal protein L23 [Gammaproteobacteria bacterium]